LFDDQYASLRRLDLFNPVVPSLRGLHQTPMLTQGQERLGVRRTSLRALSAAASVFDAALWHAILTTLGAQLRPPLPLAEHAALAQWPAVEGRRLPALPRMAWALGQDDQHRAAKRPGAFAVLRRGPVEVTGTAGNGSERAAWRRLGPPGGFSVVDRGSADAGVLQELHDLPGRFLCRVQDNAAYEGQEERPLSPAAAHAGGVHDCGRRRLGTTHQTRGLPQPFRVVRVAPGTTQQDGTPDVVVLVTHRLDLDAELSAGASRSRWAVALCFRWGKGVLGCRQVLSQGSHGVRIQVSAALLASLGISLWVGRAPTKRTDEMLCFSRSGWATEAAWIAPMDRWQLNAPPTGKN